jgi:hypothetical protein
VFDTVPPEQASRITLVTSMPVSMAPEPISKIAQSE